MSNYEYDYRGLNVSNNREIDEEYENAGMPNMSSPSRNDIKTLESIKYTNRESARENPQNNQLDYSMSTNGDSKLRLQLMEKDKIIFEFSKTLKETERVLENTKKLAGAKEEVIINLKDEIKDLKFRCKNFENLLRHKEEEMEKYKNYSEEKVIFLNKEKSLVEDKLGELTKLFENNQVDFQNTLIEYKKIEKQLVKLKQSFGEKNEIIGNYEKTIEGLKKENKSIMGLKKQIDDMDGFVNELKQDLINEKRKGERTLADKEDLERKFKEYIEDSRADKDMAQKALKMSYEIETLRRDSDEKYREIQNLNEKYKNLVKDNDNFVYVITNEIGQFTSLLENPSMSGKGGLLKPHKNTLSHQGQFSQFSLKYELINKNFEILKNKIIENYNNSITMISKLERVNSDLEKSGKDLQAEKDAQLKEFALTKQKLEDLIDKSDELLSENTKLKEDYANLKQNYLKAKIDYEDVLKRNDEICGEIQIFMNNCYNKLKDKFPDLGDFSGSIYSGSNFNYAEKILYYLDILMNDYNKLSLNEKEYLESIKMTQLTLKNSEDEKELLKARIERILQNKEDELQRAEASKTEELKRQREILYEKISSMTGLLEESNQMISLYEQENKELKDKINKLEFNLKMLTNSHLELENSITGNISTLQNEVEEKEYKYNHLLREIELKTVHIESVENMLKRKEEEIEMLKNELNNLSRQIEYEREYRSNMNSKDRGPDTGENYENPEGNLPTSHFSNEGTYSKQFNPQSTNNYMASSGSSFRPNEENERQLRNLISNHTDDNREEKVHNTSFKEYGKIIGSSGKNLTPSRNITGVNQSNSNISTASHKIPGKIYSIKKN